MPTLIAIAFVVELGLDTTKFREGRRKAAANLLLALRSGRPERAAGCVEAEIVVLRGSGAIAALARLGDSVFFDKGRVRAGFSGREPYLPAGTVRRRSQTKPRTLPTPSLKR